MRLIEFVKCSAYTNPEKHMHLTLYYRDYGDNTDFVKEFTEVELTVHNLAKYGDCDVVDWSIENNILDVMVDVSDLL